MQSFKFTNVTKMYYYRLKSLISNYTFMIEVQSPALKLMATIITVAAKTNNKCN